MRPLLLLLLLAFAAPGYAASAPSCHCFRDRAFDAARPGAADPYALATAQNSFLGAAFGLEKKGIVQAKMTGTANEDLWVAHLVAARAGVKAADLLDARARAPSWAQALAAAGVGPARVGGNLGELLARAPTDAALASAAVDAVVTERLRLPGEDVAALRRAGAGDAEVVAAALLGRLGGPPSREVHAEVKAGRTTWSAQFHARGVELADIDGLVKRLLGT